jgi:hypothetical protein
MITWRYQITATSLSNHNDNGGSDI